MAHQTDQHGALRVGVPDLRAMAQDQLLEPRQEAQVEALGTRLERPIVMRARVQKQGP